VVKEKGDINRILLSPPQCISFSFLLFQESVYQHEFGGLLFVAADGGMLVPLLLATMLMTERPKAAAALCFMHHILH